jgi:nicotinic acetylcholine receptor
MTTIVWLKQEWIDFKLTWEPHSYGNISTLYVPAEMIWTPDIVLYNKYSIQSTQFAHSTLLICSADGAYNITITNTKATLHYNGLVKWEPPAIFVSLCMIDVEWFPFDIQQCKLQVRVNLH